MIVPPRAALPDLSGRNVLVIEDDYYLASDLCDALEAAGASVVGPCPDTAAALTQIEAARPDCAILDVNLGNGPGFEIAQTLQAAKVPFLFVTGYDATAIDARFSNVERIEKPANTSKVLDAVARLVS